MRGATPLLLYRSATDRISTHTPHAGRDLISDEMSDAIQISTHTPHAGRDTKRKNVLWFGRISTHTPHAGRDPYNYSEFTSTNSFLLTRPMRGATVANNVDMESPLDFYSHAPCGARPAGRGSLYGHGHFYSHAPCGARPVSVTVVDIFLIFLLTRPMRGAT